VRLVLTLACPDRIGLVAAVSGFLADRACFVTDSNHYGDPDTGRFFMRTVFLPPEGAGALGEEFAPIAVRFAMTWELRDADARARTLVLVSREQHCLSDLLYRMRSGSLAIDVAGVLSNHADARDLVTWHGVPFHYEPDAEALEARLLALYASERVELVVLARYMRILGERACARLSGRAINIHHSFLPSFKGARPYHQAHARGVKLIGATAHYVTGDLDEGPIIEQAVERVDHAATAADLAATGHDIESAVLARAVRYHVERRVLVNGSKTVVFR